MIHLNEVTKEYPDKVLFKGVSVTLNRGMRVGLVGANGSGKTTLFRMILGEELPDEGSLERSGNLRFGHLPQEIAAGSQRSILNEVMDGRKRLRELESHLAELLKRIEKDEGNPRLTAEYGRLQTRFESEGGYEWEIGARKILGGLGFRSEEMAQPLEVFSGGWRMRAALARLLVQDPDVLLLDEPTNHLDLESLLWLEGYLASWSGTLILISHDRQFLNGCTDHILAIDQRKLTLYTGNYDDYQAQLALAREQQLATYKQQQRKIAATERFIERFRYKNTKATQVQSRIKQLEKLERIEAPAETRREIRLNLPQPSRGPRRLVHLQRVDKAYGENRVFSGIDLEIERGQKIALVGPNGAGKSTLLKLLAEVEAVTGGKLTWTDGVERGYFAQHQLEQLQPERSVFDSLRAVQPGWEQGEYRSYLGRFMFSGDAIDKQVRVLSGGERSRLALACMLSDPRHLLLLDEPTNHLDMTSRSVVEAALSEFTGALVVISHDRHFLNTVTNLTLAVGEGGIKRYEGNYDYYVWKRDRESQTDSGEVEPHHSPVQSTAALSHAERKRVRNRIKKLPELIVAAEKDLEQLEQRLKDPAIGTDAVAIQAALEEKARLEEKVLELLQEQDDLESLMK